MYVYFLSPSPHPSSFGKIVEHLLDQENHDMLTRIIQNIEHIAGLGGHPQPPTAKPLRHVDDALCEIRTPYGREELLRIYYFVDRKTERMVLLNCITKPDGRNFSSKYQGNAGKKLERELQESIALAVTLKVGYSSTNPAYDPFPNLTL